MERNEMELNPRAIAAYIDHTVLKPQASLAEVKKICEEAKEFRFASVCVNPCYVPLAKHLLQGTEVKVVTVVGFPLGATFSSVKALEAKTAMEEHADEIDMVMNVSVFKTGDYAAVTEDIRRVVEAAAPCPVKVIIEAACLTPREKRTACRIIADGGAKFVKTSTGFGQGGATVEDVKLLREEADKYGLKVKAAGGIRDAETAKAMVEAGADRIGTSAGAAIAAGEA